MKETGTQTTTQKNQPWGPLQDVYKTGLNRAEGIYQQGPYSYYPGQTYADFSGPTQQGLNTMEGLAGQGGTVAPQARQLGERQLAGEFLTSNPAFDYLGATARGEMVGQNPYLDAQVGRAQQSVADMTNAQFAGSGRTNSAYHAGTLGRNMGDIASGMYGDAYGRERANQLTAAGALGGLYGDERGRQQMTMGMAPQMDASRFADSAQMMQVGGAYDALEEARIREAMQRYDYNQQAPSDQLSRLFGFAQGVPNYSNTSTSQPTSAYPGTSAIGGAISGATLADSLGISPWFGAAGGGLLGYG